MYDWPELRQPTDAFWEILKNHFADARIEPPQHVSRFENETASWLSSDLFFSQTCGYPYATRLAGHVELLGTPHFAVEGWQGPYYSSAVIVRRDLQINGLEDSKPLRFAYNGETSLSGFRCLNPLIGNPARWFDECIESGGHRRSAAMVAAGEADIAAIDALCWHFVGAYDRGSADMLRVLQWTPLLPALPYITRKGWTLTQLAAMKLALQNAVSETASSPVAKLLPVSGVSLLQDEIYQSINSF
jgi:ABC-type phosphate/phosphonate transport system substrate-binding protein